jgi:hypothetical protein
MKPILKNAAFLLYTVPYSLVNNLVLPTLIKHGKTVNNIRK